MSYHVTGEVIKARVFDQLLLMLHVFVTIIDHDSSFCQHKPYIVL